MRERPILFSAPMVRAILADEKTMTRRIVRLPHGTDSVRDGVNVWVAYGSAQQGVQQYLRCPYGQPGDQLWVRETWGTGTRPCPHEGWRDGIEYRADEAWIDEIELLPLYPAPDDVDLSNIRSGWRPSIHMPRWASRISLEVTSVAVQRLQAITPADVLAEGFGHDLANRMAEDGEAVEAIDAALLDTWATGWDGINGHRAAWASNPFVWVVSFKRVKP